MLERHIKNPNKGGSLLSDDDHHDNNDGDSSSEISAAGTSSSKENLQEGSEHKLLLVQKDVEVEEEDDEDDHSEHDDDVMNDDDANADDHPDNGNDDTSKRKSVLELANAIEASLTIATNNDDEDAKSVSTPTVVVNDEPQSQFWSLRSSVTSNISKVKQRPPPLPSLPRLQQQPSQHQPPQEEEIIIKTPIQESKEAVSPSSQLLLLENTSCAVSPVTSPAAILCSRLPSPSRCSMSTSNRTVITRETLEGSGPQVRLTRAELLRQKAKEKKQQQHNNYKREEAALKPSRTNGFVTNKQLSGGGVTNRQKKQLDYPKPWLVSSSSDSISNKKKQASSTTRTSRNTTTSRAQQERRISTGREPQINKLPGRRSRSKPAITTKQKNNATGNKVRLTRSAILKMRQSQERAAATPTLQDLDNQRLGIPPVKFLEIPNSPTKISFEDDEMEHPNDIARRKLRQLFDTDNNLVKARR